MRKSRLFHCCYNWIYQILSLSKWSRQSFNVEPFCLLVFVVIKCAFEALKITIFCYSFNFHSHHFGTTNDLQHTYICIYMSCKHCILFRAHQTQASDFTKLLHRQSKQTKNITYCTRWENAMPTQCHCMQEAKRAKLMGFLPPFTYATMPFVCVDNHGKYHSKYWCNTAKSIITLQYILSLRKNSFSSANKTKQLYNKEADLNSKKKKKSNKWNGWQMLCVCVCGIVAHSAPITCFTTLLQYICARSFWRWEAFRIASWFLAPRVKFTANICSRCAQCAHNNSIESNAGVVHLMRHLTGIAIAAHLAKCRTQQKKIQKWKRAVV